MTDKTDAGLVADELERAVQITISVRGDDNKVMKTNLMPDHRSMLVTALRATPAQCDAQTAIKIKQIICRAKITVDTAWEGATAYIDGLEAERIVHAILAFAIQPSVAGSEPVAWQRRIKDRYGKWQDWVDCSGDPQDQQRWCNIGCEIRALYTSPPSMEMREAREKEITRLATIEECANVVETLHLVAVSMESYRYRFAAAIRALSPEEKK